MVNDLSEKINFNAKKHSYSVGRGKEKVELRSVTSWIKSFFAEFDEKEMSLLSYYRRKKTDPRITPAKIRKEWKQQREYGTKVHREVQEFVLGLRDLTHESAPHSVSAFNFFEKLLHKLGAAHIYSEQVVYSKELRLAGTIDLLLVLPGGTAVLVDWKTNKEIKTEAYNDRNGKGPLGDIPDCNYYHYVLQLSAYAFILEKEYGLSVEKLYLVHVQESGFEPYPVNYMKDKILEMLKHDTNQ